MADDNQPVTTADMTPSTPTNTGPTRLTATRIVQNFLLIWLDAKIDQTNDDYRNMISELRKVVNTVQPFTSVDECIEFLHQIQTEKVFMIVSGSLGERAVPMVHDMSQLAAIYVFCANKTRHERWASQWVKIRNVFTDLTSICAALRLEAHACDQNSVSFSLLRTPGQVIQDKLDSSFMYTQLLKEILLTIKFESKHFEEFLAYCRQQFAGNTKELDDVKKFEDYYHERTPVWWYTCSSFLYSMLNRALRLAEIDLIIKMGFFIRDLCTNIVQLHDQQYGEHNHSRSFTVYRGQNLTQAGFDLLKKTQGGLISFNSFLSTSKNYAISLKFAERAINTPNLIGVLFIIGIDPTISAISFADVSNYSFYQQEEEILFSMQSVFRIDQINQIRDNVHLWKIELTLTSDNNPQVQELTNYIRQETLSSPPGWYRLGQLLLKMGESNKAEQVYQTLLEQADDNTDKAYIYNQLGSIKYNLGEYSNAIAFYNESSEIREKSVPQNDLSLATSYNNIGAVYHKMGNYTTALSYYEKAFEIRHRSLPSNHPDLATSYNNIAAVHENMSDYEKALSYYEKALAIRQQSLPENHPDLASSYNNIAVVYVSMGDYAKALSAHKKAVAIRERSLPANHPDLATSYNNISGIYENMGNYSEALSCLQRALVIKQKSLPPSHPSLASTYSNIGLLYYKISDYSSAIFFMNKAIQIYEKSLSTDHPNLAIAYNNIALVYDSKGQYSNALSYHEKALAIRQMSLPAHHPDLAITFNNLGLIYDKRDQYSEALDYYNQALEIYRQTLPENHPNQGATLNNIGEVYNGMGNYSQAYSYYQQALAILEKSLSPDHPHVQLLKENINRIKHKL